jgi:hypothetical protein
MAMAMAATLEALPPEIWSFIVQLVDDRCFAWFVLRRVSPFLRHVTEGVFATQLVSDFSLRFAGDYADTVM